MRRVTNAERPPGLPGAARVQLPVVFGGAAVGLPVVPMFGQWCPLVPAELLEPLEPVEPVLAVVVAGAAVVEAELALDCVVGVVDVELDEAALATAAPPIAPATASTASALTMRGRMVGWLPCVWGGLGSLQSTPQR